MTLLKIIFVFIIIYYFFSLFGKYIFPWLLKSFMKNAQKKYQQNAEDNYSPKKKTGDINIDHIPKTKAKKDDADFGEYVDFEDIDN